jgi:hypothetical protein
MSVDGLAGQYRTLILEQRALSDQPRLANKIVPKIQAVYEELRATREGQRALSALMDDLEVGVRLHAAVDSWEWDSEKATLVLEKIMNEPSFDAISARYGLKGLREGTRR